MLIDHIGQIILKNGIVLNAPYSVFTDKEFAILLSAVNICHIIGRIAFPIFCFLLAEGFLHTHNIKRYMLNLGAFAIVSEPVYDLGFRGKLISSEAQNVLFTLLLGLIVLAVIEKSRNNRNLYIRRCFIGSRMYVGWRILWDFAGGSILYTP